MADKTCTKCGRVDAAGNAKDSVERLEQAKKYLLANAQFHLPLRVV